MSKINTNLVIPVNGEGDGRVKGMYKNWFLDYASYVILERAIPSVHDGLKPVQRRIFYSMKVMDDGRYNKVANIIGHTMQYHPHGDAAIGDALVNLGQKDLMIDCQGNWGDTRTGDRAAASRYIEARLSKFALDVAFNKETTEWQLSYDGRKSEPINLPMKFPLLLFQGADGIAVGLATKILPHNFVELIKASIRILQGKKTNIKPDFPNGGQVDVSNYNRGKRGGKVRLRAEIQIIDKNTLSIRSCPYGVTTTSLIDSVLKAQDKGKLKVKKIVDNTAKDVDILIDLPPGVTPEVTIDALYAFTYCEISISPNACVIIDDKPHFLTVDEILEMSTLHTKDLLRQELEIKKADLEEKWHFASLEKIFIENRIYRDIEESETWEDVIATIDKGLSKYIATPKDKPKKSDKRLRLKRDITEEDIVRLTEIKIKRISKFNKFKADERIADIEKGLKEVQHNLNNLTDFCIAYFQELLKKYGKGKERKAKIKEFDTIQVKTVAVANKKLYVDYKEGFVGTGIKGAEFLDNCSELDDVIAFCKDGKFMVTRVSDKTFIGKNILFAGIWRKGDERMIYNMIYSDPGSNKNYAKRFTVTAITRDRLYDLTKGDKRSKTLWFTANPNGEAEVVNVKLSPTCKAKKKDFNFDFSELAVKGRASQGNIITRWPIVKVTQVSKGESTLAGIEVWYDEKYGRLNKDEKGKYLGAFEGDESILAIFKDGSYQISGYDLAIRFDPQQLLLIQKFDPAQIISCIYYHGEKKAYYVKRFYIETTSIGQRFGFISEAKGTKLSVVTLADEAEVQYVLQKKKGEKKEVSFSLHKFMDVKGWKALGNKLGGPQVKSVKLTDEQFIEKKKSAKKKVKAKSTTSTAPQKGVKAKGIKWDLNNNNSQGELF